VAVFFAPEPPWWLVRKGKIEKARNSLLRLTSRNSEIPFNVDVTIAMIKYTDEMEKLVTEGTAYWDLYRNSVSLRRTEIVCMVWAIQNLCGSSFMGYSTYFYEQAGLATDNSVSMSLGLYGIGALGTISNWFLMSKFGRRTLYFWGEVFMTTILLVIGFTSLAGKENTGAQWAIGSMLLVYTFMYDSTIGPVCYSLVPELPSTRLKTKSVVTARNVYNIVGLIANTITPRMMNPGAWNWGAKSGFFWAGSCFLCAMPMMVGR
jgi:SP family general alpha glucoside:H+ symporter-like MFS transporter